MVTQRGGDPTHVNADISSPPQLSEWDAKMRVRRQADERPAVRNGREAAEDPNATGTVLATIWEQVRSAWSVNRTQTHSWIILTMEAVASHPNAPPDVLWDLFPVCARAFCANPIAPFLLLERPDFVSHLSDEMCSAILCRENAPASLVAVMASDNQSDRWLAREARLHIAFAGEVETEAEWHDALNAHWQVFCREYVPPREESEKSDTLFAHWHNDFAEIGLAPTWAGEPPLWMEPTARPSPHAAEWLRFASPADEPNRQNLWRTTAPGLKHRFDLMGQMGKKTSPYELLALLHTPGSERGVLHEIIAAHPAANETVITSLARLKPAKPVRVQMAASPHASTALLAKLSENSDPLVRRLARRNKNAPPNARELSRRAVLKSLRSHPGDLSLFVHFICGLHGGFTHEALVQSGESDEFALRLLAALSLSTKPTPLNGDPANRTSRDLLRHLARDGNRLVRWAAQKRLAEPNFVFKWAS